MFQSYFLKKAPTADRNLQQAHSADLALFKWECQFCSDNRLNDF